MVFVGSMCIQDQQKMKNKIKKKWTMKESQKHIKTVKERQ